VLSGELIHITCHRLHYIDHCVTLYSSCLLCIFYHCCRITTEIFPRYCCVSWLGLLTCKNRLPYNLYCVGGDVKHCTIQSNCCVSRAHNAVKGVVVGSGALYIKPTLFPRATKSDYLVLFCCVLCCLLFLGCVYFLYCACF